METFTRTKWRTWVCPTCYQDFKAHRIDAVFCSPRCRKYYSVHRRGYPTQEEQLAMIQDRRYEPGKTTPPIPGLFEEAPQPAVEAPQPAAEAPQPAAEAPQPAAEDRPSLKEKRQKKAAKKKPKPKKEKKGREE